MSLHSLQHFTNVNGDIHVMSIFILRITVHSFFHSIPSSYHNFGSELYSPQFQRVLWAQQRIWMSTGFPGPPNALSSIKNITSGFIEKLFFGSSGLVWAQQRPQMDVCSLCWDPERLNVRCGRPNPWINVSMTMGSMDMGTSFIQIPCLLLYLSRHCVVLFFSWFCGSQDDHQLVDCDVRKQLLFCQSAAALGMQWDRGKVCNEAYNKIINIELRLLISLIVHRLVRFSRIFNKASKGLL